MIRRLLSSRFLRNAATLQAGGAVQAGLGFVSSVALAHVLGARQQGLFVVALQVYALLYFFLNLGVVQVAVTQVASASARGNADKAREWLAFLLKAYVLLGLLLGAGGWLLLPPAVRAWRTVSDVDPRVATWGGLLCLTPLLDVPRAVAVTAFQGTRRMVGLASTENAAELVRTFLVVAGALATGTPTGPVLGHLAGTALGSLAAVEAYRRARGDGGYPLPEVRALLAAVPRAPLRPGLRTGVRFGVMRQVDALATKVLPPLIVQTFGSSAWVAYLRIAQSIMNLPLMLMQGISRTALPALSELKGVRDHERFRRTFLRATWMGGGLIAAGVLAALPVVPLVVRVLPESYRGPIVLLCLILALGYVPLAFAIALDSFYLLMDRLRAGLVISVLGFAITLPLSALLAARFPQTGAAWGLACTIGWVVVHYAYVAWVFRRERRARVA